MEYLPSAMRIRRTEPICNPTHFFLGLFFRGFFFGCFPPHAIELLLEGVLVVVVEVLVVALVGGLEVH